MYLVNGNKKFGTLEFFQVMTCEFIIMVPRSFLIYKYPSSVIQNSVLIFVNVMIFVKFIMFSMKKYDHNGKKR